jgi:hypothetical protein
MPTDPTPPSPSAGPAHLGASPASDAGQPESTSASPQVRAQLLATEHWSLLATRNTVQSEVLSRITTFLMLVSSSIISLTLVGQFTRFDGRFITFGLVLLGALVVIGTLTQMRVGNASIEDLAHVIGMNRLRAGYVEIDPTIERYLVTSAHDDPESVWQTYNPLLGPNQISNVVASSGTFITFVASGLAGAFAAVVAVALDAPGWLVAAVAGACGLAFLVGAALLGRRHYRRIARRVLFPAPPAQGGGHRTV